MNQQLLENYKNWRREFVKPHLPPTQTASMPVSISHGRMGIDAPYSAILNYAPDFDAATNAEYQPGDEFTQTRLTPEGHRWICLHDTATGYPIPLLVKDGKPNSGEGEIAEGAQGRLTGLGMSGLLDPASYASHLAQAARIAAIQQQVIEQEQMEEMQKESDKLEPEQEPEQVPDLSHPMLPGMDGNIQQGEEPPGNDLATGDERDENNG